MSAMLIDRYLFDHAQLHPTAEAFRCGGQGLSYSDLAARAAAFAAQLRRLGVGRGDLVGLHMHKSLDLAVAVYGILAAGAGYVPLDPTAPPARLTHIAADCDLSVVAVGPALMRNADALRAANPQMTLIAPSTADGAVPFDPPGADMPEVPDRSADDIAYILFTSGSTGTPKGIVHSHRSAAAWITMATEAYDLRPTDRMANVTPLHFDMSTFEFFGGPAVGACVVLVPEPVAMMPASLTALLETEQATTLYTVPFALAQMVDHGALEARDLKALRWVIHAGDAAQPATMLALAKHLPHAQFSNAYGPSEVNVVTIHTYDPTDIDPTRGIPIGQPAPHTTIHIDPATSELLCATPAMMTGYWRDPERTAQGFEHRTRPDGTQQRYYRTGDLVEADDTGCLWFHGRADRQVKVRGFRVELDEVELALTACANVQAAAAVLNPSKTGITGYVLPRTGADLHPDTLTASLRTHLPAYAVPDEIHIRATFPRTSSGKIDRKRLLEDA